MLSTSRTGQVLQHWTLISNFHPLPSLKTLLRYMLDLNHTASYFYIHLFFTNWYNFLNVQWGFPVLSFPLFFFSLSFYDIRDSSMAKWPPPWALDCLSQGSSESLTAPLIHSDLFLTVIFFSCSCSFSFSFSYSYYFSFYFFSFYFYFSSYFSSSFSCLTYSQEQCSQENYKA